MHGVALVLALGAGLVAPAVAQEPAPAPAPSPAAAPIPAAAPAPPAAAPRPFKDIVKDAREIPGYFTLWQKDDKVWIELKPEQLERPFYFAVHRTHGLGERGVDAPFLLRPSHIAFFRKFGNQVQLIAQNSLVKSPEGSAMAIAASQGFSDSLLASAAAASQPHPERKSTLVEANALLLTDIAMGSTALETAFRMAFAFDARNSRIVKVRNSESLTGFNLSAHYAVPRLAAPPVPGTPAAASYVPPPRNTPDPRSLFLGYHIGFSRLPDPMQARPGDDRVGYFAATRWNFADDTTASPREHLIWRWRLEKQDPAAALSPPKKPIVYWLDRNMPEKYRPAVTAGILEWNKAFERIGFKDAIQVKVQGPDDDFDTSDTHHASVRWLLTTEPQFGARGPSHIDPRTGEILDADIEVMGTVTRNRRRDVAEVLPRVSHAHAGEAGPFCDYGALSVLELDFALDVLEARGELDPDGPEAEAYLKAYLKDLMMHEVGHTLGLRHNYRASSIYPLRQLSDRAFSGANALSGSVMEYLPINIAAKDERQGDFFQGTLGPYDYWAIEYGYKPLPAGQEREELARIAGRSAEPALAYATDEDAGFGGAVEGIDPEVNRFDLGDDPLAWYRKRLDLSRELWDRMQAREFRDGEGYQVLRRNLVRGLAQVDTVSKLAAKYIGGVRTLRDHAGTGRLPFSPVPAAEQREALKLIASGLLSADSFRFKPEFLSRLAVDHFDRFEAANRGSTSISPEFSLSGQVLATQRSVLDQLMGERVAARILDSELQRVDRKQAFSLAELYDALSASVWSELKAGKDIDFLRRNLQRDHLRRVANALLKPSPAMPADARSLLRENARSLSADLRAARARRGLSKETQAHLAESLNTLEEALKAPLARAGA